MNTLIIVHNRIQTLPVLWIFLGLLYHAGVFQAQTVSMSTNSGGVMQNVFESAIHYAKKQYPQYVFEAPLTGRIQINFYTLDEEKECGIRVWESLQAIPMPSDLKKEQFLMLSIGKTLAKNALTISNAAKLIYNFRILKDSSFNAYCLAGGEVLVNSGVFRVITNNNELAFVIAHEIGHGMARHVSETKTRELIVKQGRMMIASLTAVAKQKQKLEANSVVNIMHGYDLLSEVAVILPHSRGQETEADRIALILMSMSGYDPQAGLSLLKRMAGGLNTPSNALHSLIVKYASDHPLDQARADDIKLWLDEFTSSSTTN